MQAKVWACKRNVMITEDRFIIQVQNKVIHKGSKSGANSKSKPVRSQKQVKPGNPIIIININTENH